MLGVAACEAVEPEDQAGATGLCSCTGKTVKGHHACHRGDERGGQRAGATWEGWRPGPAGSSSMRMTDPAMPPGTVPAISSRVRRPRIYCCRQYRYSVPGAAIRLESKLVR
jgi:hypothetical protein